MDAVNGWKTVITGVLLTVLAAIKLLKPGATLPDATTVTGWINWVLDASGPLMILLRLVTKTPVGVAPPPKT